MLLSAAAVPVTYGLGMSLFGRAVGIGAALLMIASVTFWSYGGIALAYPALALFSAWTAYSAYRAMWEDDPGAWLPLALAYGVGAGFRPDLLAFLAPVFMLGLVRLGAVRAVAAAGVAAFAVLFWLVPTVALSGGVGKYLAVLNAYTSVDVVERYSSTSGGLVSLGTNLRDVISYTWYALYAITLPLLAGLAALRFRRDHRWLFFLVWLAPMLSFYVIVHIGDPGYVFAFLPALVILASKGLWEVAHFAGGRQRPVWLAGIVLVCLANTGVFLFYPRLLTAQGVRQSDRDMAARIGWLQTAPDDGSLLLLSYDSYRHLQFYLPDWMASIWVDPFAATSQTVALPAGVRWLIIVDPRLLSLPGERPPAEPIPGTPMARLPVGQARALTFGGNVLSLK